MSRGFPSIAALLACCGLAPPLAHAQYEVDEEDRIWLRALIDVRVARGPEFPSWTDSGPGKLRYGGRSRDADFEQVTRVDLAKLAVQFSCANPDITTTIAGSANPNNIRKWADWIREPIDQELLAEVQAIFAPVKNLGHLEGLPENN